MSNTIQREITQQFTHDIKKGIISGSSDIRNAPEHQSTSGVLLESMRLD